MSVSAAQAHEQLLADLRAHDRPIRYSSPPKGPRAALPPKECESTDCYFHQHYGRGCKATIVVMDGLTCRTYRQLIGEVQDYA
jgi:hypothetical protein